MIPLIRPPAQPFTFLLLSACYDSKLPFNPSSHPPPLSTPSSPFSSFTVSQHSLISCLLALRLSLNRPSFPPSAHSILFHCSHIFSLFRCLHLAAPLPFVTLVPCPPIFPRIPPLFVHPRADPSSSPHSPSSTSLLLLYLFSFVFFFLPVSNLFFIHLLSSIFILTVAHLMSETIHASAAIIPLLCPCLSFSICLFSIISPVFFDSISTQQPYNLHLSLSLPLSTSLNLSLPLS